MKAGNRKRFGIGAVILVLMVWVSSACSGGQSAPTPVPTVTVTTAPTATVTTTATVTATPATTVTATATVTSTVTVTPAPGQIPGLTQTPTATISQSPTSYKLNQPVTVGSTATWTVLAARNMGNTLPASMSRYAPDGKVRTTTGKFIQVSFLLENVGDKIYNTLSATATMIDSQNREFKPMDAYYDYVPQGQDFLNVDLLPRTPKSFVILYEVPADATGLSLKVSDFALFFTKTALINLGL
jgi:hypothetical protein